jgi:FixJ family two-component response regulator
VEPPVIAAVLARDEIVSSHHIPNLSSREQEVLLLQFYGFEATEIAEMLGTAENTVKNQVHQARSSVVPPALPRTRANAALWTGAHRACCMATAFAMLTI